MRLKVPPDVASLIRNMHPHLKNRVRAGLNQVLGNPDTGKFLRFELEGLRSFRIGKFRLIYRLKQDVIEIVALGPRARIYEETYRLIKKDEV